MNEALQRFSVEGSVAVVTGASSGIGRHMATELARAGAKVVLIARRQTELNKLVESINEMTDARSAHSICCNLNAVEDFDLLTDELCEPFGAPTRLINAAGVNFRQRADEVTAASWEQTLKLNLTVPFFLSRAIVKRIETTGSIINIASLQSERAFANSMPYGASKGGIAQLTRAMAEAWSPRGIRANAIAPGFFKTELTLAVFNDENIRQANADKTCIGRNGELDDLTGPTLFLCSEASAYITGQILYVDGGFTAR